MAYAIVAAGGKQFWVEPGRFYDINRLAAEPDDPLTLDQVLLVNDGEQVHVGRPLVAGATVEVKVLQHIRGPKLVIYKMRPKKKTRKKTGHRQELTRIRVEAIRLPGQTLGAGSPAVELADAVAETVGVE
ncbi:MAG: 50S ribosomal protein L21 [Gloeomargaritaceae cyanobacterium C42_A2020_066]|nr:50S ribosomal protein L21 [Gloeomargaritaceae cyanobacterium C42_A2020_066]